MGGASRDLQQVSQSGVTQQLMSCGPLVMLYCLLVRAPHPPDSNPSLAAAAVSHNVFHDALCSSKCVQTEEQQVEQVR